MTLTYDIDISYVMPEEAFGDPIHSKMLESTGITLNARSNYIAKFRDPNTAAALSGASEPVKEFFKSCGFALIPSGVQLPAGTFDARFDNHVTDVLKRLEANIQKFDLPKVGDGPEGWNGLDIGQLTVWFANCEPVGSTVQTAARPPARSKKRRPSWMHIGFLGFLAAAAYAVS